MESMGHPRPPYHACVAVRVTGGRHNHNQVNHQASYVMRHPQCSTMSPNATSAMKGLNRHLWTAIQKGITPRR